MNKRYIIVIAILILAGAGGFCVWNGVSTKGTTKAPSDVWALPASGSIPQNQSPKTNEDDNAPQSRSAIFTTDTATLSDEVKKRYEINPNEPEWFGTVTYDEQTKKTTHYQEKLGFEIVFPSKYAMSVNSPFVAFSKWAWIDYLNIYDANDASTDEFHVIPVSVSIEKQPRVYGGDVFQTIEEYVRNFPDPENGIGFVTVNGISMAYNSYKQGDAADAPIDEYMFMKDNLVYRVTLNSNNPDAKDIVESMRFR